MQNLNLSVIPDNPLFPNPLLPKTSVFPNPVLPKTFVQRISEVTHQSGMTILSVIPGNLLLWAFLMENLNLGIAKMSVTPENSLFSNPVLPKTFVHHLLEFELILNCLPATCTWSWSNPINFRLQLQVQISLKNSDFSIFNHKNLK